ncbi:hypothetical protein [Thalassovita sp.]|uniref:hypothetical protein n=1 Tax=Thalassovita sp. TaxID=1979401 RepID=UPI002B26B4D6|nr:hypothetical protein [Thalassovita sp.]
MSIFLKTRAVGPAPRYALAVTICLGVGFLASAVSAQASKCLPRDTLVNSLSKKYNEQLTGGGLQNPQQLIEVWSSSDTGSFTVFITRADGISCILATGRNWNAASLVPQEGVEG